MDRHRERVTVNRTGLAAAVAISPADLEELEETWSAHGLPDRILRPRSRDADCWHRETGGRR